MITTAHPRLHPPSGVPETIPSIVILHRFALLSVVDAVVANLMLVQCGFRAPI